MLTFKNRLMATVAMLSVATPSFLLVPSAEAISTVVAKQPVSSSLIARDHNSYGYGRYNRYIDRGRQHRHHQQRFRHNSFYQTPVVIFNGSQRFHNPLPQIIYAPAQFHHQRRCVRTLYSTICN
jgi:hypothetical protein